MWMAIVRHLVFVVALFTGLCAQGQEVEYVVVESIRIEGNKRTRDAIILRELHISPGDSIPVAAWPSWLKRREELIINTGLFNAVELSVKEPMSRAQLVIKVKEQWYIYPVPIFELVDRNFNVWWVQQNRSLQRINFGVEFAHLNTTGRSDKTKVGVKYGYTRDYYLSYAIPYISKKQKLGLFTTISYARNREVNYASGDNQQLFYRDEDRFVYSRFRAELGFSIRPALHLTHFAVVEYKQNQVIEEVATDLNPDFFLGGRTLQRYFMLTYYFAYDYRDSRAYPWSGNYINFKIQKDGIGIFKDRNALTLTARYDHYFPFGRRWSLAAQLGGKLSVIRAQQPYNDYRALGYGFATMRGYEYYVVDGMDMVVLKASMRYRLFDFRMWLGFIPIKQFKEIPVRIGLALNGDLGYANDPYTGDFNTLSNRMLMSTGLGLDVVFFYDKVLRVQYSVNHLWEKGLFLKFNANI